MKASFVVVQGKPEGLSVPLKNGEFLIGRENKCNLRPSSELISKRHCRILTNADAITIEDLGSTNGTFVNGTRIDKAVHLGDGDLIKIGPLVFAIKVESEAATVTKKDDDILDWLVGDGLKVAPPDGFGGESTVLELPVGAAASANDTVHDGEAVANPVESNGQANKSTKSGAVKKDVPDTAIAANEILARYLDRRRTK